MSHATDAQILADVTEAANMIFIVMMAEERDDVEIPLWLVKTESVGRRGA